MPDWTDFTREELYELVWQQPLQRLAERFDITDVGLAKTCRRSGIPVPPRGSWARKAAGQDVERPPLPPSKVTAPIRLRHRVAGDPAVASALHELIDRENQVANRIVVAGRLSKPHPLVEQTRDALQFAKAEYDGLLDCPNTCLDVSVTSIQLSRALRIMNALVLGLEERGCPVRVDDGKTVVEVAGVPVKLWLKEATEAKEVATVPEFSSSYSFHYRSKQTVRSPTGKLSLHIEEPVHLRDERVRRTWSETAKKRLEDKLNDVVAGMHVLAAAVNEQHRRNLEREQQRALKEQQRLEALQRQKEMLEVINAEKRAIADLLKMSARWQQAGRLRAFVDAASATRGPDEAGFGSSARMDEWAKWALDVADRLDPLVKSPLSILDQEESVRNLVVERGTWW